MVITANNEAKIYGTVETFSSTAFTETGLVTANGNTITGVTETSTGAPVSATVGSDLIITSGATGGGLSNYTITYANGSLTVSPAALVISANNETKTYGTLETFSSTAFTDTGLVTANGDTVSGVTETGTGAPVSARVGSDPIIASGATGTGLSNYTITYVNGSLTVSPAALVITANNETKTYGTVETFSATAFTETGLVTANGDTVTGVSETSTGAAATATVGTYPIIASGATGTGLSNYTITYVNGSLTVSPAALVITANNETKTYGTLETFSSTAFTETGLVTANGDTITGVTETSTGAPVSARVGSDPIIASGATGTGLSNYTITYVNGSLTVSPAALVITANNETKTYGTVETFSATAFTETGLVTANGDTVTGVSETSTGAAATATVGTYPIIASNASGSGLANYTISYASGTLTVAALKWSSYGTIYIMDPTAGGALDLSGSASVNVTGNVIVDSSSSSAIDVSGAASVKAAGIQVVGGVQKSGSPTFSPQPVTGSPVVADPLAGLAMPAIPAGLTNYGSKSVSGSSSATLQPGIYSQISVSGAAKVTLAAGTYVIQSGGLTASGSGTVSIAAGTSIILEGGGLSVSGAAAVSGNGVTVFNFGTAYNGTTDGGKFGPITLSGSGSVSLTPATSGTYAGILIFQGRDNADALTISGAAIQGITGMIYAACGSARRERQRRGRQHVQPDLDGRRYAHIEWRCNRQRPDPDAVGGLGRLHAGPDPSRLWYQQSGAGWYRPDHCHRRCLRRPRHLPGCRRL